MRRNIGESIRLARQRQKLSQPELAELIGVDAPRISKWEKGKNLPDVQALVRLAEALKTSVDELLMGEDAFYRRIAAEQMRGVLATVMAEQIELLKQDLKQYVQQELDARLRQSGGRRR